VLRFVTVVSNCGACVRFGAKRRIFATHRFGRFRSEAQIERVNVAFLVAVTEPSDRTIKGATKEARMSRVAALFVGVAALTVISTVAEAAHGCGRGWYYNGRRCVPQHDMDYRAHHRPHGLSLDLGPNLRLHLHHGNDDRPRHYYRHRHHDDDD
jgi:hypothetical protein